MKAAVEHAGMRSFAISERRSTNTARTLIFQNAYRIFLKSFLNHCLYFICNLDLTGWIAITGSFFKDAYSKVFDDLMKALVSLLEYNRWLERELSIFVMKKVVDTLD
ncbi:hypothetical protein A9Q81_14340 [Gammaproteobacteria bacterium 42_54_T18]|nr:hypothetical protein A9Q81_14340 [Gammaproteobacteria bacterium 42_54_T18]